MATNQKSPKCIGTYDAGNVLCDGDNEHSSCAAQPRCSRYLELARTRHVSVVELIAAANKKGERLWDRPRPASQPKKKDGVWAGVHRQMLEKSKLLVDRFYDQMVLNFGEDRVEVFQSRAHRPQVTVVSGRIFCHEDQLPRRFVWRYQRIIGYPIFIAAVQQRVRDGLVNIYLPYSPEVLGSYLERSEYLVIRPTYHQNGQERCICRRLGKEQVEFVADMLGHFHNTGIDELPKVRDFGVIRTASCSQRHEQS